MCSITDALSIVGDRYALLVVRELRYGQTRFQDIAAGTGAPRDVLTARLRKLEQAGVIERRQYSEHPPRHEYLLTDAGKELQPIPAGPQGMGRPPLQPRRRANRLPAHLRRRLPPLTVCAACREPVGDGELTVTGGATPSKRPCNARCQWHRSHGSGVLRHKLRSRGFYQP